jgi:hypothetical protein
MINVNLKYYDFGYSGGGLVILLLNRPPNRAPIVHEEVYYNIDFFLIFLYLNILIISHKLRVFANVVSVRIYYLTITTLYHNKILQLKISFI